MPTGPNADCAMPRTAETIPPPTIAMTISDDISFAFAGKRSIARPMHMPKLFAVRSATNATIARNANAVPTNGIAAVADNRKGRDPVFRLQICAELGAERPDGVFERHFSTPS